MVGFPASGPNSILAAWQEIGSRQNSASRSPFEHKPGQSGNNRDAEGRARAGPRLHILLFPANAIGASLYPNLP